MITYFNNRFNITNYFEINIKLKFNTSLKSLFNVLDYECFNVYNMILISY
jgi:hypothetical protein